MTEPDKEKLPKCVYSYLPIPHPALCPWHGDVHQAVYQGVHAGYRDQAGQLDLEHGQAIG